MLLAPLKRFNVKGAGLVLFALVCSHYLRLLAHEDHCETTRLLIAVITCDLNIIKFRRLCFLKNGSTKTLLSF